MEALAPAKRGPKGPSKLTDAKRKEIDAARATGASMDDVAAEVGVSRNSVSRGLAKPPSPPSPSGGPASTALVPAPSMALVPLARPAPRDAERQAARSGALVEAVAPGLSLGSVRRLVVEPSGAVLATVLTGDRGGNAFTLAYDAWRLYRPDPDASQSP